MKKLLFLCLALVIGASAFAQTKIQLRSADNAECVKSDMTSLKASFSFSTIEAENMDTKGGEFSWLSMPNTVLGGNEGEPQIPVVNELIAVPFGANPTIRVTSYRSTDYQLNELGVKTLIPRQPSLRKDKTYDDVPFVKNEAAYQSTRGLRGEPTAVVQVVGTMRGVQLGKMTIEPVSYDPVNNTLRVFNNIEVEVNFDGADAKATEDMLVKTYSPYFNVIYKQLFNDRMLRDAYSQHPDLYSTPVKMLVVTTSTYANSEAFNTWKTWKIQKGIDVDVLTVADNATASTIKTQIYSKYNSNHPSFLVIVGDETVVTYYQLWDYESTYGNAATDLEYASVDGDVYHDMFLSRIPVSSTTELSNYVNKALTYEKYTMSDPSYLSNVLLIAGADGTWAPKVGRPTINYAANNYFNTSNGFTNVYKYVTDSYTGCYNYLSSGVGFANYTAHGDIQKWHSPELTNSGVEALTNSDKYFWAMGNCCLTCNFKNAQNSQTCFGETMIRVANKGAFGYIGSVPESYWYEDYYFGVGATSTMSTTPSMSQTTLGVYDMMFDDTGFNTLNAVPFAGNVAVTYAHANSYTSSVTDEYYWRAYQCFGDGSIMPYHTQPAVNNVSHANTINIGASTFTVNADAGSYVAITKDNVILGVKEVPSSGTANVTISGLTSSGDVMIVVTRQQRQPYITTIQAISNDGPYISLDSYTPNTALIGESTNLSLTFKNVGNTATSGTTTVTLSCTDATFGTYVKTFSALAANATTTVSGFSFTLNNGVTLGSPVTFHYTAVNGSNTWEGNFGITPNQVFNVNVSANNNNYGTVSGGGQYNYNESCTVTATPADGYMFTSWTQNGNVVSTNAAYTFNVTSNVDLVANFASGVMIGDGGTSTNDYLPSYNYYNYSLTEQIYTSAELGGAGIITSIAFYNGGEAKTRTYDFYMKTTTKSTFTGATDWITVSASDKVFSGSVTMVSGDWTTITFSNPFVYDGTSNVVLVADDNTGTYTNSPHMSCRVFTATNQALYAYNDGTNYNPLAPPTSSSTNNAVLSSKNQIVLTKETIPTESFNITVSANPAQAATVTGGGEYQFGQTCTVTATPNSGYTFTGWTENGNVVSTDLSFSFTATSARNLVANFIQAIEIGEGTTTHNYLPTYNYYNYSMTEQIYTADEIGMAGTITCIAFYNEGAEKTRTLDFYLKATDKTAFSSKTDWITVSASEKVFSGEVTLAANTWSYVNFTTPFEYDGTSNLVLVVDDNSGAYTSSPHLACSVYNANGTQTIYIYSDGTNYNPASPTTSQSSNYATLEVKNHIMMGIEASGTPLFTITATANPTNGGTVTGGSTFEEGETCTLTATANTGYNFTNWTMNGNIVSTDATYTFNVTASGAYVANFTAIPQYTITIAPDDVEHGTVAFGSKDEDDELVYDFEDGWQGWTTFQGNTTSPNSWMHNTAYPTTNNDFSTGYGYNSSDGFMLSESYISGSSNGSGTAVTPDNYLVSPQVRLGGSISFYAGARNTSYCAEKFSVMVSTTDNTNAASFTTVGTWTLSLSEAGYNSTPYTVDLSSYNGMGYVAIRHFDCYDQWFLAVDNVTITQPTVDDGSLSRTFYQGESCTVVATPNTDYNFVNWTQNGTTASSSATYTFTVTSDRDLVANFTQQLPSYTITATANPTDGGTVTGGGTLESGQSCTLTATAATGYTFTNWTMNGSVVSTNATYTFTVSESGDYVANFTLNSYEVTATANPTDGGTISGTGTYNYGATATLTATAATGYTFTNWMKNGNVVSTDATYTFTVTEAAALVANFTLNSYEVTATANPEVGGTITGTGTYNHGATATLTATAAEGYTFTNWTKSGNVVSTNATYSFTVTEAVALVANFAQSSGEQAVEIPAGWGWWSTNIEIALEDLETALGTSGTSIVSQNGAVNYMSGFGWDGSFTELDLSQMYEINVTENVELNLSGLLANPENHPVTIHNNWNWIGYPVQQSMNVNEALANLSAASGDKIKSKTAFAERIGSNWTGSLQSLEPGQGYMYHSNATGTKTFTYPTGSKGGIVEPNATDENNFWKANPSRFANNMNMMAVVEIDGIEATNDNVEIGAFVDGECRGSIRLMYVEEIGRHLAFLTIHGETGESVSFKVSDANGIRDLDERIVFQVNGMVGEMETPYVLHASSEELSLFPNPVNRNERVHVTLPASIEATDATVEVYNALGALVGSFQLNGNSELEGLHTTGMYTVKVTDQKGNVHFAKLVVK